ncbi:hypothetical protein DT385_03665 [Pseudomonas syringae]|nr:hypothetical protein DT385_03665 [Pseudomonas syringae]
MKEQRWWRATTGKSTESRAFSAARAHEMTPSASSKLIARLEDQRWGLIWIGRAGGRCGISFNLLKWSLLSAQSRYGVTLKAG